MLNLKGKLYVAAIGLLTGGLILVGSVATAMWAAAASAPENIQRAAVETGEWVSTCSGGLQKGSCDDGVLEVTFDDGSRTHIDWYLGDTIGKTITVASTDGSTWVAEQHLAQEDPALIYTITMVVGFLMALVFGGIASFVAYELMGNWGFRRAAYNEYVSAPYSRSYSLR